MRKLKLFFACLLMAVLSIGQVWGVTFTAGTDVNATKTITKGGVTLTLSNSCPALNEYSEYRIYSGATFTISSSSNITGIAITTNTAKGNATKLTTTSGYTASGTSGSWTGSAKSVEFTADGSQVRILSIVVTVASSCDKKVTISKGTPSHGDFTLSEDGALATCDAAVTVVVDPTPAEHYKATGVIAPNSSSISAPDEDGKYTVTYAQNTNAASEINVTFTLKDQHTVTWNNHGIETTSQVYDGEKPVFPSPNPTSCDVTSTTFIGWATAAWEGKLPNLDDKTVYTSASAMPAVTGAVTYYAVYAKVSGTTGWVETAIGNLTSSDVFVFSDGSYALNNNGGASNAPTANAITVSAGKITSVVADNLKWNISGNATDGYTFYPNGDSETWLYCNTTASSSSNNNMRVGTGDRKVFVFDNAGVLVTDDSNVDRYLCRYQTQDFRGYINKTTANTTPVVPKFYKYSAGTTSDYMTTCAAAGTCEAPSFSPVAGTFDVAQDVELLTSTPSATIYYTLDGSDPDDGSDEYTAAIHITQNTKIKAITYAEGLTESSISEGVFKIRYAQPTFSVDEGEYDAAQNVTISATGADAIYYTVDGADPTVDPANLYDGSNIEIKTAGTHTIKAIAVKDGYETSPLATAVYEMNLPYGSIAEFIAGAPTAAAKDLVLEASDNCVITGINGTTIYAQDASGKGIMIYGLSALPTNAAVNHQITGTINAKYQLFKHQHEMTNVDFSSATISAVPVSRPAVSEYTTLAAAYAAKPMMLVKLTGVKYEGVDSYYNATFGSSKIYNTFNVFNASTIWPETTHNCDITGIVIDFNGTLELLPVFASDIVADADAAAPVFTPAGGADAENAVQVDLNSYVNITAADAKHSVNVDQVQITSTDPVSVTAVSSRDFYRDNTVTKWYYGNSASASYDITIEGVTTQGNVVAQVGGVEAISAKENDEVHILITPNTHFELATITVNGNDPDVVSAGTEYSFEMPAAAVTIAVTWNEDAKATLTFAKGEATGTEDAPTAITDYVGETVQLPANPFTYNGYKFIGWSCDGGSTKLAAGADYELAENKAFVAYWSAIPTFNDADHEWKQATSLEAGKYYVIGSASQDKTASKTITSGYMSEIDSEIEDGVIAYNALGANTAIFLLGGNSTDGWTLTEVTTDDVLGTTANKNVSWNAGTQVWAISIAEGGNATIGGTSRILHNAANTGKRFTTYTSDLSASMLLPQLYVWTEKAFKLRYDANGGTNAPTATPAAAGKATVTDEQPTAPTGKIFDGWNENELGTGENYAAGDEVAVTTTDVTIYAKWRDPYTFTVSYDANEGEGSMDADADQEEGSLYTIKPNEFTREGYGFAGWKAYDALDNELTITNGKFYIPTSNVTVKAQWNEIVTTNFVLVGNVNQLNAGDEVYIVAAASNNAMGAQDNVNYRSRVEIGKTADNGRVIITGTAPVKFTLGKVGENFTFFDGEGYLCATSSSSNNMGTQIDLDDNGKWSISINASGEATIIAQGTYTRNYMQYNANSGQERFSCYKSDNTMPKIAIYKKASAEVIRGELSNGKWGTICPKQTVENATGATFYQISYLEEQNGLPFNMVFDPITGTTLTAGQPYFFIATGEEITGVKVGAELSEADDAGVNGFYGYIGDDVKALSWKTDYVAGEDNTFVIYGNTVMRLNAATNLKSERCYININATEPTRVDPTPGAAPRRRVVVGVSGTNVATGIDALNASETPVKMIIDGQLFIIRGEKMYNVNGQVVK